MSRKKSIYNTGDKILLKNKSINENRLYTYYSNMALNRFKWTNLPKGLEGRHIEKALFKNGQAFFYKDPIHGFLCLPCNDCNEKNILGDPLGVNVTGHNFSKIIDNEKGIRILENDLKTPPLLHISHYVDLLSEVELTIFMNLDQQKFPFIIPTTKKNQLTMNTLMNKYSNYENMILIDEKLSDTLTSDKGISILNTNVPYLLDKLSLFKKTCQNELFSFLGLNNNNDINKKERLLTDEVNANNSYVLMSLDLSFKNRKKACKMINEKFGLNVKVEKTINDLEVDFNGEVEKNKKEGND